MKRLNQPQRHISAMSASEGAGSVFYGQAKATPETKSPAEEAVWKLSTEPARRRIFSARIFQRVEKPL
jgi:hypothetical protein